MLLTDKLRFFKNIHRFAHFCIGTSWTLCFSFANKEQNQTEPLVCILQLDDRKLKTLHCNSILEMCLKGKFVQPRYAEQHLKTQHIWNCKTDGLQHGSIHVHPSCLVSTVLAGGGGVMLWGTVIIVS